MRKKLCRTCNHYSVNDDGTSVCMLKDVPIKDGSNPLFGECHEKVMRKTREELSLIRANAGRMGGRKAGYGKGRAPTNTITVRHPDWQFASSLAQRMGISIAELFHRVVKSLAAQHPEVPRG